MKSRGTRKWTLRYHLKPARETVDERLWREHLTRRLTHLPSNCPGCGHSEYRHAGFQCYGPDRGFWGMVGGCNCHWAFLGTGNKFGSPGWSEPS